MKKFICLSTLAFVILLSPVNSMKAADGKKTIYYFYAENCESCRRAQDYFKKPAAIKDGNSWTYEDLTIVSYRIVDEKNNPVKKNIQILNKLCEGIKKKSGKSEIVYYDRETYEYYNKKGIPYYRKQGRYVKKDEPFPTPVFIIGERIILGFNLNLINSARSLL